MTTYLDNPFLRLPLSVGADSYFGSRALVEFTLQGVSGTPPRSFDFIGLPGMGKSTLLRYLAEPSGALAAAKGALQPPFDANPSMIFPVLVEFRLLPTDSHPFIYLAERFCYDYRVYRRRAGGAGARLRDFKEAEPPSTPEAATTAIEETLTSLGENGVRTVFLLDDFHLAFARLSLAETTRLRPWRESAAFVLSTERRLNKVNANAAGSPFFQVLALVPFGGLSPKEAKRLLTEPAAEADWPFHPKDVEFTLRLAGGHPHLLITAGGALWDVRQGLGYTREKSGTISKEHAEVLVGHYKERFAPTFEMYFEHLDDREQEALRAMAAGEVLPLHQPALAFLMKLGLAVLTPASDAGYHAFSPLFEEFIASLDVRHVEVRNGVVRSGVEGRLLEYMAQRQGTVCTFEELARHIWGEKGEQDRDAAQRRVQVAISRLRKRLLESKTGDVRSVRGKGYKLVVD
jgi:hypothetical protein